VLGVVFALGGESERIRDVAMDDLLMPVKSLLAPFTPLYAAVVRARAAAYGHGLLKVHDLPLPVVSVGNLTFGGTGKTPTVIALVRDLVRRGRRPAVLTRGYGRRGTSQLIVVGPDPELAVDRAGDEPLEMAGRLPGVPIVVDADRVRGGREATRLGADVLVLDDGFQHLRLARDLDLVLVDAGDPWGGGALPPRGRLREPLTALARASAVLVTKVPADAAPVVDHITDEVTRIAGARPLLTARLVASRVRTPSGWELPDVLAGRRVLAFAGIGRPQGFVAVLEDAGAEVVATRWYRDHHRYVEGDLERVVADAAARGVIAVTTTKDAVKLPSAAQVWVVEAEMRPETGDWNALWRLLPGERS
jgi:tetraacyldisaccharide 4'-kinase